MLTPQLPTPTPVIEKRKALRARPQRRGSRAEVSMKTSTRNTAGRTPQLAEVPCPDGKPYRLQMVGGGGRWRGYADTVAGLMGLLIPGYAELDAAGRLRARIRCAVDAQVTVQAAIAVGGGLGACSQDQWAVLLSGRDIPPVVGEWSAPVPLVLVTSFYKPAGPIPRPTEAGGQVVWIESATEWSLLKSLHSVGWITVSRRRGGAADKTRRLAHRACP